MSPCNDIVSNSALINLLVHSCFDLYWFLTVTYFKDWQQEGTTQKMI